MFLPLRNSPQLNRLYYNVLADSKLKMYPASHAKKILQQEAVSRTFIIGWRYEQLG